MDYPAFRARLFPLGSGAIESTVKNLIQQRQVLAGMRWTREGAHFVANLRALHRSVGRWDAFWRAQPLRRLQALRAPAAATVPAAADQPALVPAHPPAPAPPDDAPPQPARSLAARIQTAGKPWGKGKDFWHRSPIGRRTFA